MDWFVYVGVIGVLFRVVESLVVLSTVTMCWDRVVDIATGTFLATYRRYLARKAPGVVGCLGSVATELLVLRRSSIGGELVGVRILLLSALTVSCLTICLIC